MPMNIRPPSRCRTVIGERLKQSGMRWSVRGANYAVESVFPAHSESFVKVHDRPSIAAGSHLETIPVRCQKSGNCQRARFRLTDGADMNAQHRRSCFRLNPILFATLVVLALARARAAETAPTLLFPGITPVCSGESSAQQRRSR